MSRHSSFIKTPISSILSEAKVAMAISSRGIEMYPLCSYIMHSVFLKMTGFQEQKMKCVCWELASDDYEYRYERFTQNNLGECSNLKEKNFVLLDIICAIKKKDATFCKLTDLEIQTILDDAKGVIAKFVGDTRIDGWAGRSYTDFINFVGDCKPCCFWMQNHGDVRHIFAKCDNCRAANRSIKEGSLCDLGGMHMWYDAMYKERNRKAHNTTSYQVNLPLLNQLKDKHYRMDNFFLSIMMLLVIDFITIRLFEKYESLKDIEIN